MPILFYSVLKAHIRNRGLAVSRGHMVIQISCFMMLTDTSPGSICYVTYGLTSARMKIARKAINSTTLLGNGLDTSLDLIDLDDNARIILVGFPIA